MKIFLIVPSANPERDRPEFFRTILPSVGLASIGAVLQNAGHRVFLEDQNASAISDKKLIQKISSVEPDIIGISCLTAAHNKIINLCETIKFKMPGVYIALGNMHASYFSEEFLKTGNIDFIVHGEGEYSFLDLAKCIQNKDFDALDQIEGISFVDKGKVIRTPAREPIADLDSLPYPAWDLYNLDYYKVHPFAFTKAELLLPVQASRGCKYHCDFCVQDKLSNIVRRKSTKRIIEEIRYIHEKYNIKYFGFSDAYFPPSEEKILEFCDVFESTGLHKKLKWGTSCCVDLINEKMLKRMKDVGLIFIYYGFESGDAEQLKKLGTCDINIKRQLHRRLGWNDRCSLINECVNSSGFGKSVTKDRCFKVMEATKALGIKTVGLFLIGLPGETEESINKTIDFAIKLDCDLARFALVVPYPGSKLYERCKKDDTFSDDFDSFQPLWYGRRKYAGVSNCTMLSNGQLQYMEYKAIIKFYLRPLKILKLFREVNILNLFLSGALIMITILTNVFKRQSFSKVGKV